MAKGCCGINSGSETSFIALLHAYHTHQHACCWGGTNWCTNVLWVFLKHVMGYQDAGSGQLNLTGLFPPPFLVHQYPLVASWVRILTSTCFLSVTLPLLEVAPTGWISAHSKRKGIFFQSSTWNTFACPLLLHMALLAKVAASLGAFAVVVLLLCSAERVFSGMLFLHGYWSSG